MDTLRTRRNFIRDLGLGVTALSTTGIFGFGKHLSSSKPMSEELWFKISLAQWSLHRAFQNKKLDAMEFASISKNQFDINAIEYVNEFYKDHVKDSGFWNEMATRAEDSGVKSLLIMVDDEGDLGNTDEIERKKAVQKHYKWVDAAKILGCHSIRINAFGEGSSENVGAAIVDGLGSLCEYAGQAGINVVIENHGLYSSDAKWVVKIINQINRPNCGTLPDFGNFCLTKKWGSTQNNDCDESYDRYLGVSEMLPHARGLSAKSYDFNKEGNETIIDYHKMMEIAFEAGYTGYVGIEYEGSRLSEPEGIKATKDLLIKAGIDVRNK
jgi:sugar phosphate isomerase/epimerase